MGRKAMGIMAIVVPKPRGAAKAEGRAAKAPRDERMPKAERQAERKVERR